MNTESRTPKSLLSATARFGVAAAVATGLAIASLAATGASHDAVLVAGEKFSRSAPVTLPKVEIVMRREAGTKI